MQPWYIFSAFEIYIENKVLVAKELHTTVQIAWLMDITEIHSDARELIIMLE